MLKICHMTSVHSSTDIRIFYKECASLAAAGYEVFFVAPGESREEKGVHIVGAGEKPNNRLKRMIGMARKVYQIALSLDCDIYHLHDPELIPYAVRLKRLGKKVVFDSHEEYPSQILHKHFLPRPVIETVVKLYKWYETRSARRLDAVIFPCLMNGKNIFEGRAKQVFFVDNYPILDEFPYINRNEGRRNTVCYAGRLSHNRGITHLIKASHLAGVHLLLAGQVSPEYLSEIQSMKEVECFSYLGMLSRAEIFDMYSRSDIGMATLLKVGQYGQSDNLPTKVYEYMGIGLPVIMTDYPYAREVFEKFECGICINPDSVEDIAKAILYLLEHPEKARQMGQNGRKAVVEEFNWKCAEKRLISCYSHLGSW